MSNTRQSIEYEWLRFWCPHDGKVNLDNGFLYDPDSKWGNIYNPDAKRIEEYSHYKCLILLGEPGLGKSFELGKNKDIICSVNRTDVKNIVVDLNAYDNVDRLERKVFESELFSTWKKHDSNELLYLTLESFDECLIRVETLVNFLLSEIKLLPIEHLYLRIVSRTGYWPVALENGLKELYKDTIRIIELMPLRRRDVEIAAAKEGINIDKFLYGIYSQEITAFAARPITLRILLNRFKTSAELPKNQVDMYERGCLKLCEEINPSRVNTTTAGCLPSKNRLTIAARIAAALIFSGKSSIWVDSEDNNLPDTAMPIENIFGIEELDGIPLHIHQNAVLETLATGLFSSRGTFEMGWSHQTYGEFLAAYYLQLNSADSKKIMNLIFHPDGKIVPNYYSVAAWIAVMNPEVFRILMNYEPEVLMLGDIAATTDKQKAELIETFLNKLSLTNVLDWELRRHLRYDRLNHPNIAQQLKPYITCKDNNDISRLEALLIAKACRIQELSEDYVSVALNENEAMDIRLTAASAVAHIGSSSDRARLKILLEENNNDTLDQLKGYALQATWPEYLTAEELFQVITPAKKSNFGGSYSYFLYDYLLPGLKLADIPVALKWVLEHIEEDRQYPYRFERVGEKILLYAWEHLQVPNVVEPFARIILRKIKFHRHLLIEDDDEKISFLPEEQEKRHLLLEQIVQLIDSDFIQWQYLLYCEPPLIEARDIKWIFQKLEMQPTIPAEQQKVWSYLLNGAWRKNNTCTELTAEIYKLSTINLHVAEAFAYIFEPVSLSSKAAEIAKQCYELEIENTRKKQEVIQNKIVPKDKIKELITDIEKGNLDAWYSLLYWMAFEEDGRTRNNEHTSDITILPGWTSLGQEEKEKLIEFAQVYLVIKNPITSNLFSDNGLCRADTTAYKALRLLQIQALERYDSISSDIFDKWAGVIVVYPLWSENDDNLKYHQDIVQKVYQVNPNKVFLILLKYLRQELKKMGNLDSFDKFDTCWDEKINRLFFKKFTNRQTPLDKLPYLIKKLIDFNNQEAIEYAKNLLIDSDNRALIAAKELIINKVDAAWTSIWEKINSDIDFGKKLMLDLAYNGRHNAQPFTSKLCEEELANLYIWLETNFPRKEDPRHDGVFTPTSRDEMKHFRDGMLEILKNRGTEYSCAAITHICNELPHLDWLKLTLERAEKKRVEKTWIYPDAKMVLELIKQKKARIAQSERQLLDVIVEALQHIQKRLQGENPLAPFLWDQIVKRPKWENDFSDFIVQLLRYELVDKNIILHREVEIRSNRSGTEGERTDIYVDAISDTDTHDKISLIIEVKGCWHKELLTAMETQLVGRYLRDNSKSGLYLVGWFNCPQWAEDDSRRQEALKHNCEGLAEYLGTQARSLSQRGFNIRSFILDVTLRHKINE